MTNRLVVMLVDTPVDAGPTPQWMLEARAYLEHERARELWVRFLALPLRANAISSQHHRLVGGPVVYHPAA